ncbi:uncharacterized protein [Palaemon carinicauda]|uniref:uncharacterized protein n=1 Tax=Palaemon carinicauda TaxID=392227 RepID=UPI0035B63564
MTFVHIENMGYLEHLGALTFTVIASLVVTTYGSDEASIVKDVKDLHTPPIVKLVNDQRFLFGSYSTTTYTNVIVQTSSVFLSCLSTSVTNLCGGRRIRKSMLALLKEIEQEQEALQPSTADLAEELKDSDPGSKFGFTVWTTSKLTTTVTTFYTNTSTTIRLHYMCIVGGVSLPTRRCPGVK